MVDVLNVFFWSVLFFDKVVECGGIADVDIWVPGLESLKRLQFFEKQVRLIVLIFLLIQNCVSYRIRFEKFHFIAHEIFDVDSARFRNLREVRFLCGDTDNIVNLLGVFEN